MAEYLLPLVERKVVAEGTMAFWLDTRGTNLTFEAGQNADFFVIDPPRTDAEGNMRTFSFAASPEHKDTIMIATRMRETAFKDWLKTMPLGTTVKVVGPLGNMTLHEDVSRPAVFIAGGIGITPFRSMIEWATSTHQPHHITLFYSNRNQAGSTFLSDLDRWVTINPNFTFIPTITEADPSWTREQGKISVDLLQRHIPDLQQPIFYLAGPAGFVTAIKQQLRDSGVQKDDIRLEEFSGY
jgi:ferredoxin-NADP reductase